MRLLASWAEAEGIVHAIIAARATPARMQNPDRSGLLVTLCPLDCRPFTLMQRSRCRGSVACRDRAGRLADRGLANRALANRHLADRGLLRIDRHGLPARQIR